MRGIVVAAIVFSFFSPQMNDVVVLREHFFSASKDSNEAEEFYEELEDIQTSDSPTLVGYRGMAAMLLASHSFNPLSKLSYFKEGKGYLESAIARDPSSIELRFLRYSVQDNAPVFLSYSSAMKRDEEMLTSYLVDNQWAEDPDLGERIANYFIDHKKGDREMMQKIAKRAAAQKKGV